jgi:uncharacterized protein (TIGR03437 family)
MATSNWSSNSSDPVHTCTGSRDGSTGWFRFTAPSAGIVNVSLSSARGDGIYGDAGLVLTAYSYSGALGTELGCAKSTRGADIASIGINVNAAAGATYVIEVSTNGSNGGGTAVLTVSYAPLAGTLAITPGVLSMIAGTTQQFTASSSTLRSNAVRWAVSPAGLGSITTSGLFTALASTDVPVTLNVTAQSIVDPTVQASASITVNPGPITILPSGIDNSASYQGPSVSPGEIVTIFGTTIGPSVLAGGILTPNNFLATNTGNTQVLFDGRAAPMVYAFSGQVSAVVPYEVAGQTTTQVQVMHNGQTSPTITVPVVAAAPGIYTYYSSGAGPAAIVNQDGVLNTSQFSAVPGTYVVMFATGEGQTDPPGVTGKVNNTSPLPAPVQPVTLTIGGQNAQILYAGAAPGFVSGAMQINAIVPNLAPGNNVPIVLRVGNTTSPTVTMSITGPDSRQGKVYYLNNGSTAVQVSLYASQASPTPLTTVTVGAGYAYATQVDTRDYGNIAGIQVGTSPVRVLSQVCSFVGTPVIWSCKGSAQQPFGN